MRKVVVFGNCQAVSLCYSLQWIHHPVVEDFVFVEVDGNVPSAWTDLERALVGAQILIFQGRREFPDPPPFDGPILRIPTIYFKTFWPYDGHDPNVMGDGRLVRGDLRIMNTMGRGATDRLVYRSYLQDDISKLMDLDALYAEELATQRRKELNCDVQVADYIEKHFFDSRLFTMAWHPSNTLMIQLQAEVFNFLGFNAEQRAQAYVFYDTNEARLKPEVPIHPSIVSHFNLKWAPERYEHFNEMWTFEEYVRVYMSYYSKEDLTTEPLQQDVALEEKSPFWPWSKKVKQLKPL